MKMTKGLVMLAGAAVGLCGGGAALAQGSTDEVRAVVAEMLADSETRSSLLASGDAGRDEEAFFLASDGFRLNVGGQIQFRYTLNFRDDANATTQDDFQTGFQTRRTKLWFYGMINNDWDYRVQAEFNKAGRSSGELGGDLELQDAFVRYNFPNGFKLKWGQFKLPLLREELMSDSYLLAADRSLTNYAFSQQWSQGVELAYETETFRAQVAFSDGLDSRNTEFAGVPVNPNAEVTNTFRVAGEADYAVTGRVEGLLAGNDFGRFKDFTSPKGSDFGWLLGAAAHWQQSENTERSTDTDRDTLQYTADTLLKGDSWSLFGAFIGRYTQVKFPIGSPSRDQDFNDFGAVVQGSWRFAEDTEAFARWDALFIDSDRGLSEDNFHFVTAGINHYFAGHAAKFTVDAIYSFERTSDLQNIGILPDTGVGLLGDTEESEVVVRGQFQLLF